MSKYTLRDMHLVYNIAYIAASFKTHLFQFHSFLVVLPLLSSMHVDKITRYGANGIGNVHIAEKC